MVSKGRNIDASMQNDIVTENEKNLSNWTNTGGADISFDEGINTIIFENQALPTYNQLISALGLNSTYSPEYYYNQFISAANTKFGENNYNIFAIKMNYWHTMHTCFIFAYNKILSLQKLTNGSYGGISYAFGFFPNGVQQNFDNIWWTTECDYSGGNGVSSNNPYIYIGNFYDGAGIQLEKAWKAPFSGNINKTFVVEDGKKYYLKFNEYTTSGFVNISTDNVIITSGSNEQKLTLDNDIAETPKEYNTMITGNGTNLNIKFDLETMKSTSTITLKISDVQIYKIGS